VSCRRIGRTRAGYRRPAARLSPLRRGNLPGVDRTTEPRLRRRDVYRGAVVDGRELRGGWRDRARLSLLRALSSRGDREEAGLDAALASAPAITRSNTIAVCSAKGGVGKTTCTFVLGNLLAGHLRARCLAIDANPDFGTLASLVPDARRSDHSLADVLAGIRAERITSSAELLPFVSSLATGLHVLAAPEPADVSADDHGELLILLGRFYEVLLLDMATGLADPLAELALSRADQTVFVAGPDCVAAGTVEPALRRLEEAGAANVTVVLNQAPDGIPSSPRLHAMLDSGTYSLGPLERPTRMAIKRLGVEVAQALV
jgi:MinD-like ATPase involved in chromosome partitioning or flagellar assembly